MAGKGAPLEFNRFSLHPIDHLRRRVLLHVDHGPSQLQHDAKIEDLFFLPKENMSQPPVAERSETETNDMECVVSKTLLDFTAAARNFTDAVNDMVSKMR